MGSSDFRSKFTPSFGTQSIQNQRNEPLAAFLTTNIESRKR